ncbi:hypothetical protein BS78_05G052900 [Paspalum vaginatum]|nr:hypothetical protein BS78_05G052900 [Paspalum vaginatum]
MEACMEEQAAGAWVPCNFQLSNWAVEPAAWSSAAAFPAESEHIDQIYVTTSNWIPFSGGEQQLIEYYAAAQQHYPITEEEAHAESLEVVLHNMDELEIYKNDPIRLFQEAAQDLEAETNVMSMKMHRYPIIIRDLGDQYTVPRTVAIGPYHHARPELRKAEPVKHAAAYHCIREAGCSVLEMYGEVASAADEARRLRLYGKDVMEGFSNDDDFRHMMFFDACFLVQYMAWFIHLSDEAEAMDPTLRSFFCSNHSGVHHDVWLLENQLPWTVVQAVMKFKDVELEKFVGRWRDLLCDRKDVEERSFDDFDGSYHYQPPHLLALLRYYIVGTRRYPAADGDVGKLKSLSISVGAIELAEIGIALKADDDAEAPELVNIRLTKGILFAELSLAPLSLNYSRANRLVNMAAFELCTTPSFMDAQPEDSAVCSYLLLLSMLVNRVEDVHELRKQGVLQGGGGLTDKQALAFFTSLQSLPNGLCIADTMVQIESYRVHRKEWTKIYSFYYRNKNTILKVVSAIGALVGVLSTLVGILVKLKSFRAAP